MPLIAETGDQNAMIIDSSTLPSKSQPKSWPRRSTAQGSAGFLPRAPDRAMLALQSPGIRAIPADGDDPRISSGGDAAEAPVSSWQSSPSRNRMAEVPWSHNIRRFSCRRGNVTSHRAACLIVVAVRSARPVNRRRQFDRLQIRSSGAHLGGLSDHAFQFINRFHRTPRIEEEFGAFT